MKEIHAAIKRFGGFVRYYDTTEPLKNLVVLVAAGSCRDVLACCGGGDQSLTILGASTGIRNLWAVDINPAQLFILAAKAEFLNKQKTLPFMPSFDQLQQAYSEKIAAVKKDIRPLKRFYHLASGNQVVPPVGFAEKYAVVHDDGIFLNSLLDPFWKNDTNFVARVRSGLPFLRFLHFDIFESTEYFKPRSLDLIYLSDIFWQGSTLYHVEKMIKVFGLLRPGGKIISYIDPGEDFGGKGMSPIQVLTHQSRKLAFKSRKERSGYFVVERTLKAQ